MKTQKHSPVTSRLNSPIRCIIQQRRLIISVAISAALISSTAMAQQTIGPGTIISNITVNAGTQTVIGNTTIQPAAGVALNVVAAGEVTFAPGSDSIVVNSFNDHSLHANNNAVVRGDATSGTLRISSSGDARSGVLATGTANVTLTGAQISASGNSVFNAGPNTFNAAAGATAGSPGATIHLISGTVTGSGLATSAVYAASGMVILDNVAVETTGDHLATANGNFGSIGVDANLNGQIEINGGTVNTTGSYGAAVRATGGSRLTANNVQITTSNNNAHGAVAQTAGTVSLNQTSLNLAGSRAVGLQATGAGSRLIGDDLTVITQGEGGYGMAAYNGSQITLTNSNVSTQGNNAHGSAVNNGGELSVTGSTVTATGSGASAFYAVTGSGSIASFTDSTLSASDGSALLFDGEASITFNNTQVSGNGTLLTASAGANANVTANASTLTGIAWTDTAASSTVALNSTSQWIVTGDSRLSSLNIDGSELRFATPTGNFKTLTVGNYVGNGGNIYMNTMLGDENSPTDRLIIDGGQATGNTLLWVNNAGGAGVLTSGNGILLVDTINGATTETDAFALGSRVIAGPYDYVLHRGSVDGTTAESWFLRSVLDCSLDANAPVCQSVPPTSLRPEVSLYSALPPLALKMGNELMDSLDERIGGRRLLSPGGAPDVNARMAWVRILGTSGERDVGAMGIYGKDGPSYDYDMYGLQTGIDFNRYAGDNGQLSTIGFYAAHSRAEADVDHHNAVTAGKDKLAASTIGSYWTHIRGNGSYLDAVLQATLYDAKAQPASMPVFKTHGFGVGASLEGGYPFALQSGWVIEPQAQLSYQTINLQSADDPVAHVRFNDIESLVARIGARLSKGGERTLFWTRASINNEFLGDPETEFSSADGYVGFSGRLRGLGYKVDIGFDTQLNDQISLFANASYGALFDGDDESYGGRLGLKINF